MDAKTVAFEAESSDDVQITMELEPEKEYKLTVDDVIVGKINSNIGGKINFSLELSNKSASVKIEKM